MEWGYPHPVLMGVPPSSAWDGVPHLVLMGEPHLVPGMGYPPVLTWDGGMPSVLTWDGVPPCPDLGRGYLLLS